MHLDRVGLLNGVFVEYFFFLYFLEELFDFVRVIDIFDFELL